MWITVYVIVSTLPSWNPSYWVPSHVAGPVGYWGKYLDLRLTRWKEHLQVRLPEMLYDLSMFWNSCRKIKKSPWIPQQVVRFHSKRHAMALTARNHLASEIPHQAMLCFELLSIGRAQMQNMKSDVRNMTMWVAKDGKKKKKTIVAGSMILLRMPHVQCSWHSGFPDCKCSLTPSVCSKPPPKMPPPWLLKGNCRHWTSYCTYFMASHGSNNSNCMLRWILRPSQIIECWNFGSRGAA